METQQITGNIQNPDLLPHVEDEDLATMPHGSRLQHELNGFGDGHEESPDVGICYRNRTTHLNLPLEERHNASPAAKDIPEPHGHKPLPGLFPASRTISSATASSHQECSSD